MHDSEVERIESEAEHQRTAHIFSEAEQRVKQIQRQMRRSINKSKYVTTSISRGHSLTIFFSKEGIEEKSEVT